MRPSIFPPRGFFISASPQFVVLTHEGPVTGTTYELMNSLTYNKSANGCPVRGTMFSPMRGTGAPLLGLQAGAGAPVLGLVRGMSLLGCPPPHAHTARRLQAGQPAVQGRL